MLIMNRPSAGIAPICFSYILVLILLLDSTRPVQSIALSSLCAHFGHSCFGGKYFDEYIKRKFLKKINLGNWGKRDLSAISLTPDIIQSNSDTNDDGTAISSIYDQNSMNDLLVEQIRLVNK